jgi:hypothetical protein
MNAPSPFPIPEWCKPYLTEAADNIDRLSCGRDFRNRTEKSAITPDDAKALVGEALGFWKSRSKSAFSKLNDHDKRQRAARDYDEATDRPKRGRTILYMKNGKISDPPTPSDIRDQFKREAHVDDDRADRLIRSGRRLYRRKQG